MFFLLALRLENSLTVSGWAYLSHSTFGDQDSAVHGSFNRSKVLPGQQTGDRLSGCKDQGQHVGTELVSLCASDTDQDTTPLLIPHTSNIRWLSNNFYVGFTGLLTKLLSLSLHG